MLGFIKIRKKGAQERNKAPTREHGCEPLKQLPIVKAF